MKYTYTGNDKIVSITEKTQKEQTNKPSQLQKVIEYFIINNNEPTHYKDLAIELEILIPNMRRILGQGELKGIFNRVYKGVYNFNNYLDKEDCRYLNKINKESKGE